jgi:hypothetical protein
VYTDDLVLSSLLVALRNRASPVPALEELGQSSILQWLPTSSPEDLHNMLVGPIRRAARHFGPRMPQEVDGRDDSRMYVGKDEDGRLHVTVDYLNLKLMHTTFVAGKNFNKRTLTGFVFLIPYQYDKNNGDGAAQCVVDGFRQFSSVTEVYNDMG